MFYIYTIYYIVYIRICHQQRSTRSPEDLARLTA
jgi:hypothetical protein